MKIKISSEQINLNIYDVILSFEADMIPNIGDRISILSFIDHADIRRNFQDYLQRNNLDADALIVRKVWQRDLFADKDIYLLIYIEFTKLT